MSISNVYTQLRNIPDVLRQYGWSSPAQIVSGADANGNPCIFVSMSTGAWSAGQDAFIVRAVTNQVGGLNLPNGAITPSVAPGQQYFAQFSFDLFIELPSTSSPSFSHLKFQQDIIHVLRGNFQNLVNVYTTAVGSAPSIAGFNGATVTAGTFSFALPPSGKQAAGGYSS